MNYSDLLERAGIDPFATPVDVFFKKLEAVRIVALGLEDDDDTDEEYYRDAINSEYYMGDDDYESLQD